MKTRVIFGGSFDPVTKAHIDMAQKLSGVFDEVVVVPTFISPFKLDGASIMGEKRLEMLKNELGGIKNLTISDIELKEEKPSYSFVTAQKLSEEGVKLYFAIGSDGIDTLDKWARPDILSKLVTFFVVKRPFFDVDEEALNRARKLFKVEIASFEGIEGSSTLLKVAVAFSKADEVVPKSVAKLIEEENLYDDYRYIVNEYDRFKIKPSRREHIYRVAKCAIILAKKRGVSVEKAVKSALLHDIAKYLSDEELKAYGVENFAHDLPLTCRHQVTGAQIARLYFNETDEEVLGAIRAHTTGEEEMSDLQKIIFTADYIEEGRDFDGLDKIRATVFRNLDDGIKEIIINTVKYLKNNDMEIASITERLYEQYGSKQ